MNYIKEFLQLDFVLLDDGTELKYQVNQSDKTILVNASTREHLLDIVNSISKSDFNKLEQDVYVLFYEDNLEEILESLQQTT